MTGYAGTPEAWSTISGLGVSGNAKPQGPVLRLVESGIGVGPIPTDIDVESLLSISAENEPMTAITREELDAKLATNEARVGATETRIASSLDLLRSEIGGFRAEVEAHLKHQPTTTTLVSTVVSAAVGVLVVALAVFAIAGDRFDGGVQAASIVVQEAEEAKRAAEEAKRIAAENDKRIGELIDKMNAFIDSDNPTSTLEKK